MKYGFIDDIRVTDNGLAASVTVEFLIDRSVLYEFMDCLKPINNDAPVYVIFDDNGPADDIYDDIVVDIYERKEL